MNRDPFAPLCARIPNAPLSAQAEAIRWLAQAGRRPRLAVTGRSMLPLLHEGMVLELIAATEPPLRGEVIVFLGERKMTAHRVIGNDGDCVLTAGDAVPAVIERVPRGRIIGCVASVYAAGEGGRRLENPLRRLAGQAFARTHRLRAAIVLVSRTASAAWRALDAAHRPRTFPLLVRAVAAALRDDRASVLAAVERADRRFIETARRHRCAGLLSNALPKTVPGSANEIVRALRLARWSTATQFAALQAGIVRVVGLLRAGGVRFALLKGAARVYGGETNADLHFSGDIDVLVHALDAARAFDVLRANGYAPQADTRQQQVYRVHHHHLAPLYPPEGGAPVELHTALAPPRHSSLDLTYAALERHRRTIGGAGGRAEVLDDVATAVHLTVHGAGIQPLRDVALVAERLRRMSRAERELYRGFIERERSNRIRLGAAAALAAMLAGDAPAIGAATLVYLQWVARREDLPAIVRQRAQFADAFFARTMRPALAGIRSPLESPLRSLLGVPYRILGRALAAAVALRYASRLAPAPEVSGFPAIPTL